MNITEIKTIIENAPEGAEYFESGDDGLYTRHFDAEDVWAYFDEEDCKWSGFCGDEAKNIHSLSDLKQILALHERVEELEKASISLFLASLRYEFEGELTLDRIEYFADKFLEGNKQ